jgi:hypothetical protein
MKTYILCYRARPPAIFVDDDAPEVKDQEISFRASSDAKAKVCATKEWQKLKNENEIVLSLEPYLIEKPPEPRHVRWRGS